MFLVTWRDAAGNVVKNTLSERELLQKWGDLTLDIFSVRPI